MKIEQIAISVPDISQAIKKYNELGFSDWQVDEVLAKGFVNGRAAINRAILAFNYDLIPGKELELIQYVEGPNWLSGKKTGLSHFGMHVDRDELDSYLVKMENLKIKVVQEVTTESHTNPDIKDKRRYHYVIFNSRDLFGFDLKLIRRINLENNS